MQTQLTDNPLNWPNISKSLQHSTSNIVAESNIPALKKWIKKTARREEEINVKEINNVQYVRHEKKNCNGLIIKIKLKIDDWLTDHHLI